MRHKLLIAGFVSAFVIAALPQASLAADGIQPPRTNPADIAKAPVTATLDLEVKEIGLIVGGKSGKGILHFQGKDYPFTLKALQAGVIVGATKSSGTGEVRFLNKLEDFPGKYSAAGAGVAVVGGGDTSSFQNDKGVIFTVKATSSGLALNLGFTAGEIAFTK
jgi:hypothetical protein